MTVNNEGSTQSYKIPPSTIFNLNPYNDNVGEKIICISNHGDKNLEIGKIYTIIRQENPHFGYIWLEEFKQYPLMWFSRSCFKKQKAIYDGKEYNLVINQ